MRNHPLGRTGLFVSELCLGTMTFGGSDGIWGKIGDLQQADAERLVGQALDAGINFIDTADVYCGRRLRADHRPGAEEPEGRRARASSSRPRCSARPAPAPNARGASRGHILDGVKASLKRLQLDHIDLYQIHGFDPATPIEETVRALDQLVRHGPRALRRRVELGRLADRQGAGHRRAAGAGALRVAAGLLHGRRARPRARDRADAAERRRRPDGVEPAGRRPAQRQVRPRASRPRPAAGARASTSRRSNKERAWDVHRRDAADRARRTACRSRRSRWPGCCTSRR